jgi:hypothetical protein
VRQLTPKDLGCSSFSVSECPLCQSFLNSTDHPALYYWSQYYIHSAGIAAMKAKIEPMKAWLKNARFGANFSPTGYYTDPFDNKQKCQNYIGWTFQWVRVFREGGLTLPWGEDWIWQTSVGTQQMMGLSQDAMRSGMVWAGEPTTVAPSMRAATWDEEEGVYTRLPQKLKHVEMLFYVMKHYPGVTGSALAPLFLLFLLLLKPQKLGASLPSSLSYSFGAVLSDIHCHAGNTNNSWTRLFFNDLSHGITRFDMFLFEPSTSGYTCDYVDSDGGAYPTVRAATNMLGEFEDIISKGAVLPASIALLYSETADIYYDTAGTYGAELRSLYIALKHAQLPLDVVIEEDCAAGRLHYYDALYVTQPHISDSASAGVASWVDAGGTVFATAGAGLLNQANVSNSVMAKLLSIEQASVYAGPQDEFNATVRLVKQDINFVTTLDNVTISHPTALARLDNGSRTTLLAKGIKSIFKPLSSSAGGSGAGASAGAAVVLATFSDGSPAMLRTQVGRGRAFYCAFMPGLSYFAEGAIPLRPVDRSSVDEGMNQ